MYCPECGVLDPPDAIFCYGCGYRLLRPVQYFEQRAEAPIPATNNARNAPINRTAKGREFERDVESWLQSLGYRDTERNVKVKISDTVKPYECDVHGHFYSVLWDRLQLFGTYYYIALVVWAVVIKSVPPEFVPMGLGCFALAYFGKKKSGHHVWVECKNLTGKVNRDQVMKLVHIADSLRAYKQADWQPRKVMLVSATDFEKDALLLAERHSIVCYRKSADKFVLL